MPYELKKSSFGVWIYCPETSIAQSSDYIDGGRIYKIPTNISRIADTMSELVREIDAMAIFPCDDFACAVLNIIVGWPTNVQKFSALQQLIKKWVGSSPGLRLRSKSLDDVKCLGFRTPKQIIVNQKTTKPAQLEVLGQPIVVKVDISSCGMGVSTSINAGEAIKAAIGMSADPHVQICNGNVVAQEFLSGSSASVSFSAHNGRMLDAFSYLIVERLPAPFGASSVIKIEHMNDIISMARRIVKFYSYSGFGGIDFIIPDDGSRPAFIEFNSRQTRTTHLGGLVGADLCSAMASALTGTDYIPRYGRGETKTVALFPFEWQRDQHSPYLYQSHHDVPWRDPKITAALLAARHPQLIPT